MRYSLFVPLLAAFVPAVHVSAQTGRTMTFQTPAAIGTDFVFSATYPPAAIGNLYALLWSVPYAGAVPFPVSGFVTNGLLRLDPAQLNVWFPGAFDASGTATHTLSIPDDVNLLGFALDFQVVDIDLGVPSLNFTDNDLAIVAGGLRQDWAVVYNGPVGGHDYLRAVAADASAVVVTGSSLVQPGTWVTLLTGHMGDTPPRHHEGKSPPSAWFGWSCNPRSGATRLQVHPNHAGREG